MGGVFYILIFVMTRLLLIFRLVLQGKDRYYNGILDGLVKIIKEEGWTALFKGLTPRLLAVLPMIAAQFAVYEVINIILYKK